ncbi:FKBP-type peptidyl-prolyl cis-trans isomerase [Fimbriiglobus ruber]|uniref:peptidylprolyl isomerase n=1 Tax=Fimbriiglobus ruber TaxID=1908690 RepID=A0A225EG62_9BACT|nr:FKBP-type peptidyl-prolyl cis-trans isomerase [Fimbriiglobus ruber]
MQWLYQNLNTVGVFNATSTLATVMPSVYQQSNIDTGILQAFYNQIQTIAETTPATLGYLAPFLAQTQVAIESAQANAAYAGFLALYTGDTTQALNPTQTITFALTTPVTFSSTPIALTATGGGSGNPVTFSVVSGPATISGSQLTTTGVGTVVVQADEAGGGPYTAAPPVQQTLVVNQASQTIAFTLPSSTVDLGVSPIDLSSAATGGASGNPVTYSVVSGPGTISGNTLTVNGTGSIVVEADQAGNTNYAAATPVQQTLTVQASGTLLPQTITFSLSSPVTTAASPITLSATGGASAEPVTFSVVSGPATVSGNQLTLTGTGSVVVEADQAGDGTTYAAATPVQQTLVVNPAPAIVSSIPTVPTSSPAVTLADGTRYNDVQVGSGTAVAAGAQVTVYYTGWLASNGTEFDSNVTAGVESGNPKTTQFTLTTGSGGVIQGFIDGIVGMQPGGIRDIYMPAANAYGSTGSGSSIPPNSDLVFEVQLVSSP